LKTLKKIKRTYKKSCCKKTPKLCSNLTPFFTREEGPIYSAKGRLEQAVMQCLQVLKGEGLGAASLHSLHFLSNSVLHLLWKESRGSLIVHGDQLVWKELM
jgi:radical SAM superfamily enzyme